MPTVADPAPARPVTPVSILADLLDRLSREAEDAGTGTGLAGELRHARDLAAGLDPYLSACTTPESPGLRRLAARTAVEDWQGRPAGAVHLEREMLSGHVEGQFLRMLVRLTRAVRVLEIGLFTGYSALAMAEALPPGGTVVACEIDPAAAAFARRCLDEAPGGDRVEITVGPALATLHELATQGRAFDLVFLDADKPGYEAYLRVLIDSSLLAPDGLLCVDNTLLQGEPYLPGSTDSVPGRALAAFNAAVAADPRLEQVLLPLRDGLTLIRRTGA